MDGKVHDRIHALWSDDVSCSIAPFTAYRAFVGLCSLFLSLSPPPTPSHFWRPLNLVVLGVLLPQVPRVKYTFWNHDCSMVALASKHTIVIASKQLDQL